MLHIKITSKIVPIPGEHTALCHGHLRHHPAFHNAASLSGSLVPDVHVRLVPIVHFQVQHLDHLPRQFLLVHYQLAYSGRFCWEVRVFIESKVSEVLRFRSGTLFFFNLKNRKSVSVSNAPFIFPELTFFSVLCWFKNLNYSWTIESRDSEAGYHFWKI